VGSATSPRASLDILVVWGTLLMMGGIWPHHRWVAVA